jgi:type VI secretion system protein ImpJ
MASGPGRLNPVAWTEGMFLRPQHFQHHDLFAQERLRYHLHRVDPFHWGVRELRINEDALSDHRLEILHLEAVLPGGTIVRYPGNAVVETREFEGSAEKLDVHLALRRLRPSEPNAGAEGERRDVRFVLLDNELPDWNRGGFETPVELAHPNLRIFFSGEEDQLESHESFKLAELVATGEIKQPFGLSRGYVPPLLAVQGSQLLHEQIAEIAAQIAAKVRVVAGRTSTISIADLPRMWMRYTLSRVTPLLRHLLSTGETRPFDLYSALVDAAGSLAAFQFEEPVELPVYQHEDLGGCFSELIEFLDSQLSEAVPDRFTELAMPFDASQKFYLTSELNTDLVDPRNHYYLAVRADLETHELVKRVTDEGKAGSIGNVKVAMRMNIAGLPIEHLSGAPTEIAARAGYEYFRLDPHSPKWAKVKEDFSFALAIPKVESADVRLYVVATGS